MKFGVLYELQQQKPWAEHQEYHTFWDAIEQVKEAERSGFEYLWAVEHHFLTGFSHCSSPEVFLTAAAQHTTKMRIGHGVVLLPTGFNQPFHIAERVAALDIYSKGRAEFGTGRSITTQELGGFGIDPGDTRGMWQEVVREVPKMWMNEEYPGCDGQYFKAPAREVWPKPLQKPHPPMWMAATNPDSFELAGRNGLGILCFVVGDPERLGPLVRIYRDAIKQAEPAGGFVNEHVAAFVLSHVAEDRDRARAVGGDAAVWYMECAMEFFASVAGKKDYEAYTKILGEVGAEFEQLAERHGNKVDALAELSVICVGDPDDAVRTAERFEAQGADQLIMLHQMGRIPHEDVMRSIQLTGEHVIPRFHDEAPLAPGTKVLVGT